ncbi:hypothetical protein M8494_07840 [Serratia ureilytica]
MTKSRMSWIRKTPATMACMNMWFPPATALGSILTQYGIDMSDVTLLASQNRDLRNLEDRPTAVRP